MLFAWAKYLKSGQKGFNCLCTGLVHNLCWQIVRGRICDRCFFFTFTDFTVFYFHMSEPYCCSFARTLNNCKFLASVVWILCVVDGTCITNEYMFMLCKSHFVCASINIWNHAKHAKIIHASHCMYMYMYKQLGKCLSIQVLTPLPG